MRGSGSPRFPRTEPCSCRRSDRTLARVDRTRYKSTELSMRVLVTGGAGFIGFHLVQRLLADGHDVTSLDNLNDYYDPGLKEERVRQVESRASHRFVRMDLQDTDGLLDLFRSSDFEAVVNLAAQPGVRYSINNPFAYVESNVVGFLSVLEACRKYPVQHLVYASSSSVYGTNSAVPFSTNQRADRPISLYAATKRANELMAHSYAELYQIPSTGLRFFTVYGPWGRPDMAYFKFAEQILSGETVQVFNGGKLSRDFTYIDDIIESTTRVIGIPPPDRVPHRVYNIGRGQPVNLLDFIKVLEDALGTPARIEMLPMQPGEMYTTYADTSDLERAVDYVPEVTLSEGIRAFAEWFVQFRR
jgi:UDP-glucuronate 4-epimerase